MFFGSRNSTMKFKCLYLVALRGWACQNFIFFLIKACYTSNYMFLCQGIIIWSLKSASVCVPRVLSRVFHLCSIKATYRNQQINVKLMHPVTFLYQGCFIWIPQPVMQADAITFFSKFFFDTTNIVFCHKSGCSKMHQKNLLILKKIVL